MPRALTLAAVLVVGLVAVIPFIEVLEEWDPFPHSEYDIVLDGAVVLLGTMCAMKLVIQGLLRCAAAMVPVTLLPAPPWRSHFMPALVLPALSPPAILRI